MPHRKSKIHQTPSTGKRLAKSNIRAEILRTLKRKAVYGLEELVTVCPSYTWSQVFVEVDHLSRTGELYLWSMRPGVYAVTLAAKKAA